jgi:hypothetical protein
MRSDTGYHCPVAHGNLRGAHEQRNLPLAVRKVEYGMSSFGRQAEIAVSSVDADQFAC